MKQMIRLMMISCFFIFFVTANAQETYQTTPSSYLPSLRHTDPSFAPVVVALGCSFLFVIFFAIYLRHCSDANLAVPATAAAVNYSSTPHEPQGIDSELLDTFPILTYSHLKELKLGGGSVPVDCAVCLGEFKHDEILRSLPKCNHVFHPECIKAWLALHVTCPVCRAVLKPAPAERHREDEEEEDGVAVVIREPEEAISDRPERQTTATMREGGERGLRRCHSTGHSLDLSSPTKYEVFQGGREDEGSSHGGRLFLPDHQ